MALPEGSRLTFLLNAAKLLALSVPELASYLVACGPKACRRCDSSQQSTISAYTQLAVCPTCSTTPYLQRSGCRWQLAVH